MIERLLARCHFVKALHAWERDDWEGSFRQLQRAEELSPFGTFRAAFKAQVLLALREYADADRLFSQILDALGEPRNAGQRYTQIVCLLWQGNSFRDVPEANALWAEAMDLNCSRSLRQYLLLRQPPEFVLQAR